MVSDGGSSLSQTGGSGGTSENLGATGGTGSESAAGGIGSGGHRAGTGGGLMVVREDDPTTILGYPVVFRDALDLFDVEYADGQFIAVGERGTYDTSIGSILGSRSVLLRSTDGASWIPLFQGPSGPIQSVAYGSGLWLAVGSSGWAADVDREAKTAVVLGSSTGYSWIRKDAPAEEGPNQLITVDDGFVGTSWFSAWITKTGDEWTEHQVSPELKASLKGIVQSKGIILAYSDIEVFRSEDDGWTWAKATPFGESENGTDRFRVFRSTPDGFVASMNLDGFGAIEFTSTDGLNWVEKTPVDVALGLTVYQVVTGGGVTIRRTNSVAPAVDRQLPDGSWVPTGLELPLVSSIAYGNGTFVAVGFDVLHFSRDGETWAVGTISD